MKRDQNTSYNIGVKICITVNMTHIGRQRKLLITYLCTMDLRSVITHSALQMI